MDTMGFFFLLLSFFLVEMPDKRRKWFDVDMYAAPAKPWQRNSGGVASRPAFLTESGQTNQSTGESSGRNNNVSSAGDGRGENTASLGSDDSRPPARPWEAGNSAGNYNLAGSVSAWGMAGLVMLFVSCVLE